MAESVIGSKEVAIAIISYALVLLGKSTGIDFPLTPEQIFATGIAVIAMVRVLWTSEKIQSILPK
jgi:hypothetical protein